MKVLVSFHLEFYFDDYQMKSNTVYTEVRDTQGIDFKDVLSFDADELEKDIRERVENEIFFKERIFSVYEGFEIVLEKFHLEKEVIPKTQ